jgi:Na+-transporting NADH:ubiquinone oxidoreductase subunit A
MPSVAAIKPSDFNNLLPKMLLKPGDRVKAGTPLFYNKNNPQILFTSPLSGTVMEVVRSDKRLILEIPVQADAQTEYEDFGRHNPETMQPSDIIALLLKSGLFTFIRQRPYDTIPNPELIPRDIYISTFDSAPLAPDYQFILKDQLMYFQAGVTALSKLTTGKVMLGLDARIAGNIFSNISHAHITAFKGKHPAGNVGVQIHHTMPINKGELIWYVNPADVAVIGKLLLEGKYIAERLVAVCGPEAARPCYHKVIIGSAASVIPDIKDATDKTRLISGNVLSGSEISSRSFLEHYHHQLTCIPEGNYFELAGWAMPGFGKFSNSGLFFSKLFPKKKYSLDTNFHGGRRPFVMSGQYEKVFPFDIYPVYLLKAIITQDIDKMEALGIYEVSEEDFALCDFVCTSKMETQQIVQQGLELLRKEMS